VVRAREVMKAVVRAREVAKLMDEANDKRERKKGKEGREVKNTVKGKGNTSTKRHPKKTNDSDPDSDSDSDLIVEEPASTSTQKNAYSAQIIKHLGFDPTLKPGQKRADDLTVKKKLETLTALQSARKDNIELGPRPGQRIRSGVVDPSNRPDPVHKSSISADFTPDLDDSDTELEQAEIAMFGKPVLLDNMVDLDDSSDTEDRA